MCPQENLCKDNNSNIWFSQINMINRIIGHIFEYYFLSTALIPSLAWCCFCNVEYIIVTVLYPPVKLWNVDKLSNFITRKACALFVGCKLQLIIYINHRRDNCRSRLYWSERVSDMIRRRLRARPQFKLFTEFHRFWASGWKFQKRQNCSKPIDMQWRRIYRELLALKNMK